MTHLNRNLTISPNGLDLIKGYEAFKNAWYVCPAGKDTIGFGHVKRTQDKFKTPISIDFATALLRQDISRFELIIKDAVTVPLTQNQWDALVSLVFNIGGMNFEKSTLLKKLNANDTAGAANEFLRWIYVSTPKGKKILNGLVARRKAEHRLFLEGL